MLKGASRKAKNNQGQNVFEIIRDDVQGQLRADLESILKEPRYTEFAMCKPPVAPLRQSHKTQIFFVIVLTISLAIQFLIVLPSKCFK